jgi:hypothetical protein
MSVYKRGDTYWYESQFNGERSQQSAQTSNKEAARQIEAAHRCVGLARLSRSYLRDPISSDTARATQYGITAIAAAIAAPAPCCGALLASVKVSTSW